MNINTDNFLKEFQVEVPNINSENENIFSIQISIVKMTVQPFII